MSSGYAAARSIAACFALACFAIVDADAQNSFSEQPAPSGAAPSTSPLSSQPKSTPPAANISRAATDDAGGELKDFGIAAKAALHSGAMHGPTPITIPGGQPITTQALVDLRRDAKLRPLIFDVLGGPEVLPGALAAVPAHQPGSFDDAVQREFGQFLEKVTQGRKDTPLVFYCQSVQCWMSYNASLRAIRMGYTRVLWYRGGIEAWKRAGQPVQPAR